MGRLGAMVKCPYCGYEVDISKFKLLKEPRRFRFYTVRILECPKCRSEFNYYYGISPHGKVSEFTTLLEYVLGGEKVIKI
ncbi:hypothetical protein [Pyrodictium occultum]|uniref:hypothetical protein n=1 Tax=Pyrodictium occultum TaxID=2309 RepID=UPI001F432803|nr:hypothetical protein [Pyrodictium occultum]